MTGLRLVPPQPPGEQSAPEAHTRTPASVPSNRSVSTSHPRTSLHPVADKFDWERVLRRCQLGTREVQHLLPQDSASRPLRGSNVKHVALTLATYANYDGTNIFPSVERLARVTELDERTVREALRVLRAVGLIERMRRGSNRGTGVSDRYRLTQPEDLLEVVQMLEPEEGQNEK